MASTEVEIVEGDKKTLSYTEPTKNFLEIKANMAVGVPDSIVIDSQAMAVVADEELRKLKAVRTALDAQRESVSKPLHQAWSAHNAIYKKPLEVLDGAISRLTGKISQYTLQVQQKAEAERRLAEQQAEAERLRMQEQADDLAAKAGEAASLGRDDDANFLLEQAESAAMASQLVTARVVDTAPPKIEGTSTYYRYSAEVPITNADKIKAIKWVLENPQFLHLVTFDQKACNQLAVALKDNFAIPGMSIKKNPVIAQRGARLSGAEPW